MIVPENDVFICDRHGQVQAHAMWDDAAEAQARQLGGYLCKPNAEPLQVLADFREVPVAIGDLDLIAQLLETALQEPGFFDARVEAEARPGVEALHGRVKERLAGTCRCGPLLHVPGIVGCVTEEAPAPCRYEAVEGDPAIVVCAVHGADYGLLGDEWCDEDPDGAIRGAGSI